MQIVNVGSTYPFKNSYTQMNKEDSDASSQKSFSSLEKNPQEMMIIMELSSIDTKVRAHEAAHIAAGSGIVNGGANFSYTRGPDGKLYATGGEVPINTSEGKTPEETIQKARQIQAAAMAPADPSPQDYKVAATAAMMELKAHLESAKEFQKQLEGMQQYRSNGITLSVSDPLAS